MYTNISMKYLDINGLLQESRNSIANTLDLRLSCTDLSIYEYLYLHLLYNSLV